MNQTMNMRPLSMADVDARVGFIRRTYAHLFGAIMAFVAVSFGLMQMPFTESMVLWLFAQGGWAWLVVLGGFGLIGFAADHFAHKVESRPLQYLGLGVYVVAEAIIFTPMYFLAQGQPGVLPAAALITAVLFAGLTVSVFITKKDFSFLRTGLVAASFMSIGVIVGGVAFGFSLGLWFSALMVLIAGGSILYYTSRVMNDYRTDQHVAASLSLFSAVALLFWYVLRIVMAFTGD
jgi:FtsH-binding integral membrane protein